jgi:hypothetical protein
MLKHLLFLKLFVFACLLSGYGQTTIWSLDFESVGGYDTSVFEFSDGSYDFFTRTDGSNIGSGYQIKGIGGSYYFAAQDIDGEGGPVIDTLWMNDIDIASYENLEFSIRIAEDDDGANQDWDDVTYFKVFYDIDNSGSYIELLRVAAESSGSNSRPMIDTDFDGFGDGTEITDSLVAFATSIASTGNEIDFMLVFEYMRYGDEDIAIDDLLLTGTPAGGDVAAPVFTTDYPAFTNLLETEVNLNIKMDEPGLVFYSVLADGASAPTVNDVLNADTLIVADIASDTTILIEGLTAAAAYDVYFIAQDDETAPNVQDTTTLLEITTLAARSLEITYPTGGETFFMGDTIMVTWNSANIDSVEMQIYFPAFGIWGDLEYGSIDASLGTFPVVIPFNAGTDSVRTKLMDAYDNTFADSTGYIYLTDTIAPLIDSLIPFNGEQYVSLDKTLEIFFDEFVSLTDTGAFVVRNLADDSVVDSITSTSGSIYHLFNYIRIPLASALESSSSYYVQILDGTIVDIQGNLLEGFLDDSTWTFSTPAQDLFFSEYIEGSSNNKALEIYNPTDVGVNLNNYRIAQTNNGSEWNTYHYFPVDSVLESGEVWVIITDAVDPVLFDAQDANEVLSYPSVVHFNGNDARALEKSLDGGSTWKQIDLIGVASENPGAGWSVAGIEEATEDHTILRKVDVEMGNTNWEQSAGTTAENSEWKIFPQNTFDNLGAPTPDASDATEITNLYFEGVTTDTTIYTEGDSVVLEVIASAQLDSLFLTLELSEGATSEPASGDSIDASAGSFTISVTAEDGLTTADWTVYVNQSISLSSEKAILDIELDEEVNEPTIDDINFVVDAYVEYGTQLDSLFPVFTLSAGATSIPSSGDSVDFSDTVEVTVTAEDGSQQVWEVIVHEVIEEVSTIAELRAGAQDGTVYRLAGEAVLTYQQSYRNKKYIQDATAAIEIDDNDGVITTSYNLYDGITGITGTVGEYNGLLQFTPVEDPGAATSNGNSVTAQTITVSEFITNFEDYEAELVRLDTIRFTSAGQAFSTGKNYEVYRDSDTTVFRTNFYEANYIGATIPDSANVTGIAIEYRGTAQIVSRDSSDIDFISEAEGSDIVEVSTLAELRAGAQDGTVYQLTGEAVLTYQQSYRNKKYIQDATAAIEIDDNDGVITTSYNLYDGITGITGTVGEYNGLLQFTPVEDPGAATSTGNTIAAQTVTVSEFTSLFESIESELVTIQNLSFVTQADSFKTGTNYDVFVGSDSTVFRTNFYEADYILTPIPYFAHTTGIAIEYNGTAQIVARSLNDFVVQNNAPEITSVTIEVPIGSSITTDDDVTISFTISDDQPVVMDSIAFAYGSAQGSYSNELDVIDNGNGNYSVVVPAQDAGTVYYEITIADVEVLMPLTDSHEGSYEVVIIDNVVDAEFANMRVYPVPAKDEITISGINQLYTVSVYTTLGSLIYTEEVNDEAVINLSSVNAGIYVLEIKTNTNITSLQLIKE